jgi:cathepsin L
MARLALLALCLVFTAKLALAAPATVNFEVFKTLYGKQYATAEEETLRRSIFTHNMAYIAAHNANPSHSYKLAHNEFADLSHAEFAQLFLQRPTDYSQIERRGDVHIASVGDLPATVDWRQKGAVTGIKNQGQCGSCWSFSTTGSLEGQHFLKTGQLVSLSEQNLVDCSGKFGNQGCNGGLMDQAFEYIKANGGIDTEASYPYEGVDGNCRFNPANVGATVNNYTDVAKGSESDLQDAVANVGPVSVAIDASHESFQFYHSGVYDPLACSSTALDHGVLAVGYGTLSGKDYWLVKNSWGTSWGMQGYINMARNKSNKCGIATSASYPIV